MGKPNRKENPGSKPGKRKDYQDKPGNKSNPDDASKTVKEKCNDWSWYAMDEQQGKDAATISTFAPIGVPYEDGQPQFPTMAGINYTGVPGVCAIRYAQVGGKSTDASSALNLAAKKLYSYVRHANSGHTNYESSDLMQYVMAKSSIDSIVAFMQRAYGVLCKFDGKNRYLPKALFYAMNLDYDDFSENIADFRAYINLTAAKVNALYIPIHFPVYKRWYWMNLNLFKDKDVSKCQYYFYNPVGILTPNPTGGHVGNLTTTALGLASGSGIDQTLTFAELQNIVDGVINVFTADEDMNIMSGDILKAYGLENCAFIGSIDENFTVDATYNEEVLTQIHNLITVPVSVANLEITQNNNVLYCNPTTTNYSSWIMSHYDKAHFRYDINKESPDFKDNLVATRLSVILSIDSNNVVSLESFGTEIARDLLVYSTQNTTSGNVLIRYLFNTYTQDAMNNGPVISATTSARVNSVTRFDYFPRIILFIVDDATLPAYWYAFDIQETDNVSVLTNNELKKMHECAVTNELGLNYKNK